MKWFHYYAELLGALIGWAVVALFMCLYFMLMSAGP